MPIPSRISFALINLIVAGLARIPNGDGTGIIFKMAVNIPNIVKIIFNVCNTFNIALILFSCLLIVLIAPFLATLAWFN